MKYPRQATILTNKQTKEVYLAHSSGDLRHGAGTGLALVSVSWSMAGAHKRGEDLS
jgi:hypothetical protein